MSLVAAMWLAALVSCSSAVVARAEDAKRPNIVLILADDLGYTDVGCFGSRYYETPHVDRLAAEGVRFTSGYTCGPNCQPTRAALMSGQYGPRTGVYTVGDIDRFDWPSRPLRPVDNVTSLPLEKITLAQSLHGAGYATGMFGKWHLGNDPKHHPSARGFDEAIESSGRHFDFATNPPSENPAGTYLADFLTDKAVDFIRRHKDRPFFLYLPHFAVHGPHEAKTELVKKFQDKPRAHGHQNPTYAAMIASLDQSVGRVVATLDELGLSENTLVIFTSDNGGVGGYEREGIQGNSITDNAPLKGGKGMLYEGGIRVPFVFRWTGKIAPGATCETPINSVDMYPTLLEVAGAARPSDYTLDGESILPLLTSPSSGKLARDAIYWHFPGYLGAGGGTWRTQPAGAIRAGDWKLIEFFEEGRRELYNVRDDVGERKDLAAAQPEKAQELYATLTAWRKQIAAPMPTVNSDRQPPAERARTRRGKNRAAREARDTTSAAPRPNIVFLLADDLGSYDVGWRGGSIKTPNLDKLALGGARLEQFYVQPVCSPTRAALMTGRYPFRYGLQVGVVRPWAEYGLPLEERTLSSALAEAGYETAIVGKWHLGHFTPDYLPTRRGFAHQYGHYNGALDYFTHVRDGGLDWHRDDRANRDEGYSTHLLASEAVRRVRERDKSKPLFLYVPFNAVHSPHQVPSSYEEPYGELSGERRTYAGMLAALDEAVGQIVAVVDAEGLIDNTLFVFSSDNGGPAPGRITDNGPLRAGKSTVYEGGVRVCAFATWKGRIKPGTAVNAPLHMVDWYPTLVKLAGASLVQPLPIDGRNLWPVLVEGAASPHEEIVLNCAPQHGAIRMGDWKLVLNGQNNTGDGEASLSKPIPVEQVELFDLASDAGEKHNLADERPEIVSKLRSRYEQLAREAAPYKARPKRAGFESPKVWGEAVAD